VGVYSTSDKTKINDNVIYRQDLVREFVDGSFNNSVMVDEDGITSKEIPPPMM